MHTDNGTIKQYHNYVTAGQHICITTHNKNHYPQQVPPSQCIDWGKLGNVLIAGVQALNTRIQLKANQPAKSLSQCSRSTVLRKPASSSPKHPQLPLLYGEWNSKALGKLKTPIHAPSRGLLHRVQFLHMIHLVF